MEQTIAYINNDLEWYQYCIITKNDTIKFLHKIDNIQNHNIYKLESVEIMSNGMLSMIAKPLNLNYMDYIAYFISDEIDSSYIKMFINSKFELTKDIEYVSWEVLKKRWWNFSNRLLIKYFYTVGSMQKMYFTNYTLNL